MGMKEDAARIIAWYKENEPALLDAAEGKPIQWFSGSRWETGDTWAIGTGCKFRPVPKPAYRPFTGDELKVLVGKKLVHYSSKDVYLVVSVCNGLATISTYNAPIHYAPTELKHYFTFEDGSVVGVKEE